jgi:hypothetical protein
MFELHRSIALSLPSKELKSSFEALPDDKYVKGDFVFRKRRFAKCVLKNDNFTWLEDDDFFQSKSINPYLGDVERKYDELEPTIKNDLQNGILKKISALFYDKELHFGIHQMRTIANDTYSAKPAPEGIHQDGFDFVAIYGVQESNVNGAVNILVNNEDRNEVILEKRLTAGDLCIFNDRDLAHYVTPFTPKYPGLALRDVLVFTVDAKSN